MQGFFRYLVFVRPKWTEYRKHYPEIGRCKAIATLFCEHFGKGSESEDSTERKRSGSGRFSTSAQETGGASFFSRKTSSRASISSMKRSPFVSDVRPSPVSEEEHKEEEHAHDAEDNMPREIVSGDENDEEIPEGTVPNDCHKVRFVVTVT